MTGQDSLGGIRIPAQGQNSEYKPDACLSLPFPRATWPARISRTEGKDDGKSSDIDSMRMEEKCGLWSSGSTTCRCQASGD